MKIDMKEQELLKYCLFYKGEVVCPTQYDGKHEGKLWQAEKIICEDMPELVMCSDPDTSMMQAVAKYVGKWSPFNANEVMNTYFEKMKVMNVKDKTVFDFTDNAQLIKNIIVVDKERYMEEVKNNPVINAYHLMELADMTKNEDLKRAVLDQYKVELAASNNEP